MMMTAHSRAGETVDFGCSMFTVTEGVGTVIGGIEIVCVGTLMVVVGATVVGTAARVKVDVADHSVGVGAAALTLQK